MLYRYSNVSLMFDDVPTSIWLWLNCQLTNFRWSFSITHWHQVKTHLWKTDWCCVLGKCIYINVHTTWQHWTRRIRWFCCVQGKRIYMYIHTQPLPAMQVSEVPESHIPIDLMYMHASKSKSFIKYVSWGFLSHCFCFSFCCWAGGGALFFKIHIYFSIRNPETALLASIVISIVI